MDYTIQYLETIPEEKRAELLYGKIFYMAAPTATHQEICAYLTMLLQQHIRKGSGGCRAYSAPFDVFLFNDDKTCLQPDLAVICDLSKIDEKGCHGAPDLVVEITSGSTRRRDMKDKLNAYEKAGVREYWIIEPKVSTVTVYDFEENEIDVFPFSQPIPVKIFNDLEIIVDYYNKY